VATLNIDARRARLAAGVVVALLALYAGVYHVAWGEVLGAFRGVSAAWGVAAVASVLLTLALVTLRWDRLMGPVGSRPPISGARVRTLWDAVVVGQAVNILMPLRLGEGARVAITTGGLGVPVGRVMVAMALERAFDAAAFAAIVGTLMLSGWMPQAFRGVSSLAAIVAAVTIALVWLFARFVPEVLSVLHRRLAAFAPAAASMARQETAMRDGWAEITGRHQLAAVAVLSALIPVTAAFTNYLVLKSFDLPVPAIAAFVLLVTLQFGTAVVSVPGNVGVFHYLTVVTLATWQVPQPAAVATSIVLHLVSLGPKLILAAASARGRL
jgi:uncharacterized protein (TIRG00374 family)